MIDSSLRNVVAAASALAATPTGRACCALAAEIRAAYVDVLNVGVDHFGQPPDEAGDGASTVAGQTEFGNGSAAGQRRVFRPPAKL